MTPLRSAFWILQGQEASAQAERGRQELTLFETLFAMALCWFQKARIDLLVCETGLGGRLDATNHDREGRRR